MTHTEPKKVPTGHERLRVLYEEYIKLTNLRQVWKNPCTTRPILEPSFAAAMHGIEMSFLLLSEFICDDRKYMNKRPRIEAIAAHIRSQCQLLGELVDGELEEDDTYENDNSHATAAFANGMEDNESANKLPSNGSCVKKPALSLTQDFPFESCPPTRSETCFSPGLARMVRAVEAVQGMLTAGERSSLIKVVLIIVNAFIASFSRWTVGLGIEHQLNELLGVMGILASKDGSTLNGKTKGRAWRVEEHDSNLDYNLLVKPEVVEATLTGEAFIYKEDFFFRTVHLSTEAWLFVAITTVQAAGVAAAEGRWHVAAARTHQAGHITAHTGAHMSSLSSMVLRDYLPLKVELAGISGGGSAQVRQLRSHVLELMKPLKESITKLCTSTVNGATHMADQTCRTNTSGEPANGQAANASVGVEEHRNGVSSNGMVHDRTAAAASSKDRGDETSSGQLSNGSAFPEGLDGLLVSGLIKVYENPEEFAGLHSFAQALLVLEGSLRGGFFYPHYMLAVSVIGSSAKGTMQMPVEALKATYEKPLFPEIDYAKVWMGQQADAQNADKKGLMTADLLNRYMARISC